MCTLFFIFRKTIVIGYNYLNKNEENLFSTLDAVGIFLIV